MTEADTEIVIVLEKITFIIRPPMHQRSRHHSGKFGWHLFLEANCSGNTTQNRPWPFMLNTIFKL
jgi:hypothetical protein